MLTGDDVARLHDRMGAGAPVAGLSRVQTQVLSALARAPRGLLSARAVARRAGVSPTTASRTLRALELEGLVVRRSERIALGRVRDVSIVSADVTSERWAALAGELARVRCPAPTRPERARRVPHELRHLFWNTAPGQLDVDRASGYIARRLIQTADIDGLAWGAHNLRAADWRHAAATRGLTPDLRALALNLAAAG